MYVHKCIVTLLLIVWGLMVLVSRVSMVVCGVFLSLQFLCILFSMWQINYTVIDVVTSALLYLRVEPWHDPTYNWRFT